MPRHTTVVRRYETVQCGATVHTIHHPIDVIAGDAEHESVWVKPTKDDGTTSVLDRLRSPATVIV